MSYPEAIRRLYAMRNRGMKLDLERVATAARLRGDPQRQIGRVVHVAGTNGKGSTAAMVESIARAAGHRTGFFSSPHLHRFGERIRIAGTPLSDDELAPRVLELLAALDAPGFPELSFFEVATFLAFEAFRDGGTDVAILEVGLGGRLDATNVANADVAVITGIAHDHGRVLGEDLPAVAREKADIIVRGAPIVCARQDQFVLPVIQSVATDRGAALSVLGTDFHVRPGFHAAGSLVDIVFGDETFGGLTIGLDGPHQVDNAACAVAAARALRDVGLTVDADAVSRGLAGTRWPGRLERIEGAPTVILDVAHNPQACNTLAAYIATRPRKKRALVFGAMRDKDHDGMIRPLEGLFAHRYWTRPKIERAEEPMRLASISFGEVIRDVERALRHAQRAVGADGEVVVTGSAFVVAEARAFLLDLPNEEAIGL